MKSFSNNSSDSWYKFTNKECRHNCHTFTEGLNVSNEIYFYKKECLFNAIRDINYNIYYIWDVIIPKDAEVAEFVLFN